MRLSMAASLAACASVQAFSDTTPFVMFSTVELATPPSTSQLQTSKQLSEAARSMLTACPTTNYLLISQPNVHASDIRGDEGCTMPNLCAAVSGADVRGSYSVAEVAGQVSKAELADAVRKACTAAGKQIVVEEVELRHLPPMSEPAKRAGVVSDNDLEIGQLLRARDGDYTVLMFSDPNEFKSYEATFVDTANMELKRRSDEPSLVGRKPARNSTRTQPLFEKYQFFTPGVLMGLVVTVIILSILGAGLSALASLQVSYGAFDKENGPAAQKKQQ